MKISVIGERCAIVDGQVFVADAKKVYPVEFTFDSSWDGYTATAVFESAGSDPVSQLLVDGKCLVPWEVLTPNVRFRVGVFGVKDDIERPTIWTNYIPVAPGTGDAPEAQPDPNPGMYTQMLQLLNKHEQAEAIRVKNENDRKDAEVAREEAEAHRVKNEAEREKVWSGYAAAAGDAAKIAAELAQKVQESVEGIEDAADAAVKSVQNKLNQTLSQAQEQATAAEEFALAAKKSADSVAGSTTAAHNAATKAGEAEVAATEMADQARAAEQAATEMATHPPVPGENGFWLLWNPNTDQYEESDIKCAGAGGGGVSSWNDLTDKPFYSEVVDITHAENLTREMYENGEAPACDFIVGNEYTVVWNGVTYTDVVCYEHDGWRILGDPDAGHPFCVDDNGGTGEPLYVYNEDEDFTLSIYERREVIKTLDPKYLPEHLQFGDCLVREPLLPKTDITLSADSYGMVYQIRYGTELLDVGMPCIVNWNGVEYSCLIKQEGDSSIRYLGNPAIGYGGADTGEPFCIYIYVWEGWKFYGTGDPVSLTVSVDIAVPGIKPIDSKYLPDTSWHDIKDKPFGEIMDTLVFPEKQVQFEGSSYTDYDVQFSLEPNKTYVVNWDGEDYVCDSVYTDWGSGRITVDVGGYDGVPFRIRSYYNYNNGGPDGFPVYSKLNSDSATVTLSIRERRLSPIGEEYLPEALCFGERKIVAKEFAHWRAKMSLNRDPDNPYISGSIGAIRDKLIPGETYELMIGENYCSGVARVSGDSITIGNPKFTDFLREDTGEPFCIQATKEYAWVAYSGATEEGFYDIRIYGNVEEFEQLGAEYIQDLSEHSFLKGLRCLEDSGSYADHSNPSLNIAEIEIDRLVPADVVRAGASSYWHAGRNEEENAAYFSRLAFMYADGKEQWGIEYCVITQDGAEYRFEPFSNLALGGLSNAEEASF